MASKAQPVIPPIHLETIYEESGSSLSSSSIVDIQHKTNLNQQQCDINSNTHGLISARSIPSVDIHRRRRINESQQKLPIEVRYRDGTKRYIHPSLTSTSTGINRRKSSSSSSSCHDSSLISTKLNSKYRQIYDTIPKKKKKSSKKPPVLLTIITAEDLSRAGLTPPSTSSPDESDTLALAKSLSNSSLDTVKTVKDIDEVSIERLQNVPILPVQPVIDISVSNHRFIPPPRHHSHHQQPLRHPQQTSTIRSQSLPSPQTYYLPPNQQIRHSNPPLPPVAIIPPSPKRSLPSLQITLTSDENERNSAANVKKSNKTTSTSKPNSDTTSSESKQTFRPSNTVLVGGGSRSAFRPVLKSTHVNPQPRIPSNANTKPQIPTNQLKQNSSQQKLDSSSSHSYFQQFPSTSTHFTLQPSVTINPVLYDQRSDASKKPIYSILPYQNLSDKKTNATLTKTQQSTFTSATNTIDKSSNNLNQTQDIQDHLITVDPNLQWHSITSKSLYDVPRLAKKYSDIPLRITIPDGTPTHHQKLLQKHDIALEQRLLDAGLSPETIALYERILEVADIRQIDILSPPEIIDQYQHQSLL